MLLLAAVAAAVAGQSLPAVARDAVRYDTVSEDVSEHRRAVYVRIERRLDEDDLLRIAQEVHARQTRTFARTYVNFQLPGMPLTQGAWASVLFAPEPKVLVHGLSRMDEALFQAEHAADKRAQLGSWLTSPPAAPGRLTIYSDHGRIFAEWRLRNGQKTVDELRETGSRMARRFEVSGGGAYQLTKAGDLEIYDKTTLVATAERIRQDVTPGAAQALAAVRTLQMKTLPAAPAAPPLPAPAPAATQAALEAPQPATPITADVSLAAPSGPSSPLAAPAKAAAPAQPAATKKVVTTAETTAATEPLPATDTAGLNLKKGKKVARAKPRDKLAAVKKGDMTNGDIINAKLAGRL